ncbi:MAG: toxin glutamine deamidase domain-containing protein [Bacteroides sp.]|nr:toxin glutamine deamidase domain-containing protein [Bacteroides sp.]MCM1413678.1 toxin glutamine deamidase domain-containing protein [Bacteroides sp.]MCM1471857.1 toxin glutamine deamidase domain-containing protein [Bacteroides sp.]
MPDSFKDWVQVNEERIETAEKRGTTPYFIRDNKEYIQGILTPIDHESSPDYANILQEGKRNTLEIAAERHAARTQEDIDRIQSEWNTNRLEHLIELSDRIGSYRDSDFRELASLLDNENRSADFNAFKTDYRRAKKYVEDKIDQETSLVRKFMEDPLNVQNIRELERLLGITQGDYMTFFEANLLRGNPNYALSEAYRVNCQTCVIAHELRRRGFNIEALGNTAGSWSEKLSHRTNEIWLDVDGNIPKKTTIGATRYSYFGTMPNGRRIKPGWNKMVSNRKQLISELESSITDDGRYHIDWYWNTQSKRYIKGHIITAERINGKIRYYDPQNGQDILNFYNYIEGIKLDRGINLLRVDNLRINADYAAHILGKSESKAVNSKASKGGIGGGITPKSDKSGFKALQKQTKLNAEVYSKEIKFDKNLFYTHRLVINKDALNDLVGHAYTADELKAIEKLPRLLGKLTNARYDPLKISRPNIRKKISSGAKHFVEYDIEIDGIQFTLKTKAVKDSHGKFMIEHPYFFREKK